MDNPIKKLKVVLIGPEMSGKTSLINRYLDPRMLFDYKYTPTESMQYSKKDVHYDSKTYQIYLWDLPGQERFWNASQAYIKSSHAGMFVYDAFKPGNVQSLAQKLKIFQELNPMAVCYIVGNKSDLLAGRPMNIYDKTTCRDLIDECNWDGKINQKNCYYYEVTAKIGTGVSVMFDKLVLDILERNKEKVGDKKPNITGGNFSSNKQMVPIWKKMILCYDCRKKKKKSRGMPL